MTAPDLSRPAAEPSIARALVVGAGSAGRRHLANLRRLFPDAQLSCWRVSDAPVDAQLAAAVDTVVRDASGAQQFQPDVVVVAGPASTHVDTALPFATAGIPLLVEKPIATRLEDADRLLRACDGARAPLLVGYMWRFYPLLQRMRAALEADRIGRPIGIRAEVGQYLPDWRPSTDWRRSVSSQASLGGGAILEISHEIDYVRWLMGEVQSVAAMGGSICGLELDVEDYAEILFSFTSGAIGSVHLDFVQRPPVRRCRIVGTAGTLELDLLAHVLRVVDPDGTSSELLSLPDFERNTLFLDELRHFAACAAGRETPQVTGAEGRRVLELALAARSSVGRPVVHG